MGMVLPPPPMNDVKLPAQIRVVLLSFITIDVSVLTWVLFFLANTQGKEAHIIFPFNLQEKEKENKQHLKLLWMPKSQNMLDRFSFQVLLFPFHC